MKKLYLSRDDKKITGLCGGIAEYLEIDSTVIRLLWVFATVVTGVAPGIIAYFICAIIVPSQPAGKSSAKIKA